MSTQQVTGHDKPTQEVIVIDANGVGVDNSLPAQVVGSVAAGSTDSGNPVKVGGLVNTTAPTAATTGQRQDLWLSGRGSVIVGGIGTTVADGATNAGFAVPTVPAGTASVGGINGGMLFNGTTWDRQRANIDTAALVTLSAAGAGTTNSADQTNYNGRGVQVVADITVAGGTIAVTVAIQGKDAASGKYYTLLTSASLVATGTTVYTLYPGAPTTANVSSPQVLPRVWRVQVVSGTGSSPAVTMTVGASVIL